MKRRYYSYFHVLQVYFRVLQVLYIIFKYSYVPSSNVKGRCFQVYLGRIMHTEILSNMYGSNFNIKAILTISFHTRYNSVLCNISKTSSWTITQTEREQSLIDFTVMAVELRPQIGRLTPWSGGQNSVFLFTTLFILIGNRVNHVPLKNIIFNWKLLKSL